jgi:PAS domain S-box-containing protein
MPDALGDLSPFTSSIFSSDAARLARSEAFFRHLVENSLGLICAHDFSGALLTVNNAAARSLGYTPEELAGTNVRDLMPPGMADKFQAYLRRIQRHGKARGYMDLVARNGRVVTWLYRNQVYDESGYGPIVIGHAQDISWRVQMERSLKETSGRFRALFEDAPVAYHEIDQRGTITRVNHAECTLLGRSREELIGTAVWDLVAPQEKETSREHVRRKLQGLELLEPFHREYLRSDGSRVLLHIHERLIRSTSGQIVGIRSALLDVTAQQRVESELRQLNAELDRRVAERTAELYTSNERLKEFVYTVSHDLQEPLRTISSFGALLRKRYSTRLDEDGIEFLDYVTSGANRMSRLIQDLLAYSRILYDEPFAFQQVPLGDVVESAIQNLGVLIDGSEATVEVCELPVVSAQPNRLTQVFQNLLSNAIKYRGDDPPHIVIGCEPNELGWTISVADNGMGVRPEDSERVFGLFKRGRWASRAAEGTGVGLTICRAIVQRHGGRMWVEPGAAGGSVFRFTLPLKGKDGVPV